MGGFLLVSLANPAHQKTDIPDGFFRVEALSVCGLLNWTVRTIALPGPNSVGAPWVLWERPSNCLWRIPILKGSLRVLVPFLGFAKRAKNHHLGGKACCCFCRRTKKTCPSAPSTVFEEHASGFVAASVHDCLDMFRQNHNYIAPNRQPHHMGVPQNRIWTPPVETLSGGFPLFKQAGNTCSSGLERLRFACFLRQICGLLRQ